MKCEPEANKITDCHGSYMSGIDFSAEGDGFTILNTMIDIPKK
jgi:hypothetical protein